MKKADLNRLADLALTAIELKMENDGLIWEYIDAQNYISPSACRAGWQHQEQIAAKYERALETFLSFAIAHGVRREQASQWFDDAYKDNYYHVENDLPPETREDGLPNWPIQIDADWFRACIMKKAPTPAEEFAQFQSFISTIGVARAPKRAPRKAPQEEKNQDESSGALLHKTQFGIS
jgi:hypothetical protein